QTALEAFAHEDLPFEKLVAELRPERGGGASPLLSALLVYQNTPEASLELEGLEVSPIALEMDAVRSDLDLYAWEDGGALEFCMVYDEDLFDGETAARMAGRLTALIALATGNTSTPLSATSFIDDSEVPRPPVPSEPSEGAQGPLSYHQERLWFIDFFEEGNVYEGRPTYHNMPLVISFDGPVDGRLLESSLHAVIERHGALRTRIVTDEDGARQSVEAVWKPRVERINLPGAGTAMLKEKALEFAGRPFAAGVEPRLRAALLSDEDGRSVFVLVVHHVLADRKSLDIIAGQLSLCYSNAVAGDLHALGPEALTYRGFSEWQREVPERDWEPLLYEWKWRLRGDLPVLTLPEDRLRPAIHTFTAGFAGFSLPPELVARLDDFARREGADLFTVLLAGLMETLLCCSGQDELVVGTFWDGRPEWADASVGPFENLLPVRGRPAGGDTFRGFLKSVAGALDEARANGALPFDLLVEKLNPPVDMSRTALFDVLFDFRPGGHRPLLFGDTNAGVSETGAGLGKYDLSVLLTGDPGRIDGAATFNADIYDRSTVAGIMDRFETVLGNLLDAPDIPLEAISFLTSDEEHGQIAGWNDTAASYPERATLHGLFAEQARRTPENTAVSCGETGVSYRELDERANRLAGCLRERGVMPESLVALYLERSVDAVVAMLAVLKAGGAYLPIETSYPEERVRFMIEDSGAHVLVTTSALRERIAIDVASVVLLDADSGSIAAMPAAAPDRGAGPGNLAYCIYTSGSTGRPKGVLIEHRNVVRLLKSDRLPFDFSESDVWTMFHSYGFDFSVWEMYGALLSGGRLVVVPVETTRDSAFLMDLIKEEGVTVLNQVPSAFYSLSREVLSRGGTDRPLRYVIFGGEALDFAMLAGWRESLPAVRLVNMYGITETCVHVTFKEV
ncbi:MAG: non-ribosomal peptide synthetase, partial [Candidatus Geothermincolia bacterium]